MSDEDESATEPDVEEDVDESAEGEETESEVSESDESAETQEGAGNASNEADTADGESAEDTESAQETPENAEETETGEDGPSDESVEPVVTADDLDEAIEQTQETLEQADTEADLDEVETSLKTIRSDLEAADLPEPDEDDEEDPRDEYESQLDALQEELEEKRGPYAEDIVTTVTEAVSTVRDTRWTDTGTETVVEAGAAFLAAAGGALGDEREAEPETTEALADELEKVADEVSEADLDADEDAETIQRLLDAGNELTAALEEAEEWDDLEVRDQLRAEGFYDVLGHYKDFPPEWAALKEHEKQGNVEMVLLALDSLDSDFMERHCLEALTRMGDDQAFEAMHQRAQKRDKPGIRALGKMASTEAVDTLIEYVDTDSDPQLQKVTFRALGEIGDERAVQPLADKLVMENDQVRPYAARALGRIGDPRAVRPLEKTLKEDDSDSVRAAAAWALRQIGTEEALEAAAAYTDDKAYIVQAEADRAEAELSGSKAGNRTPA